MTKSRLGVLKHLPLQQCLAHSEIHCVDAATDEACTPTKTIKELLRIQLARCIVEVIKPEM